MKVTESDNPFVILYQAMWYYSRGFRWMMPTFVILSGVASALTLAQPYLMGKIVNELQLIVTNKDHPYTQLTHWLTVFAVISLGVWLFHGPGRVIERRFSLKVFEKSYNELYRKIQSLPLSWHQDHHSGNLISRLQTGSEGLLGYSESQFIYIRTVLKIIIPAGFIFYMAWPLGLLCLFTLTSATVLARYFDVILMRFFTKRREIKHRMSALVFDYISNIQTIIMLRLGMHTQKEVAHRLRQQRDIAYPEGNMIEYKWVAIDTMIILNRIATIFYIAYLFRTGTLTELGIVVSLVQYIQSFSEAFFDIGSRYEIIQRQANDVKATTLIQEAYDSLSHHSAEDGIEISPEFKSIDVNHMNFAYKDNQVGRIQDINLSLQAGQKIAFVGASGSGKSTTMKLLRGLYPVQSGTLSIDGVMQDDFEPLKEMTTLIPQEPEIFENTIRYNITMGVEHDDTEVMEACRIACFDTVLDLLPHGLDTDIREKGVNLSGGQKQRLALARGVFAIADSAVILLDEPTSSVDGMTEQKIYRNLLEAFPDKVLISSIHRLHMLTQFDTIYVFEQGHIVQSGSLNTLLQQDGAFKDMYQAYQNIQDQ
ncbi:MAG TPA: ABC transporter ATP-binding protein [Alphaproteobacteria bacterium]